VEAALVRGLPDSRVIVNPLALYEMNCSSMALGINSIRLISVEMEELQGSPWVAVGERKFVAQTNSFIVSWTGIFLFKPAISLASSSSWLFLS
jgi:hypothetical protein